MPGTTGYRPAASPFATRAVVVDDDDELTGATAPLIGANNPLTDLDEDDDERAVNPAAPRPATHSNRTGCVVLFIILVLAIGLLAGVGFLGYNAYTALANQTPVPTAKAPAQMTPTPAKGQIVIKDALAPGTVLEVTDLCGNKLKTTVPVIPANAKFVRRTVGSGSCGIVVEFQPSQ